MAGCDSSFHGRLWFELQQSSVLDLFLLTSRVRIAMEYKSEPYRITSTSTSSKQKDHSNSDQFRQTNPLIPQCHAFIISNLELYTHAPVVLQVAGNVLRKNKQLLRGISSLRG
jgi:hypothetical protein